MTMHDPISDRGKRDDPASLIERAASVYDFTRALEERAAQSAGNDAAAAAPAKPQPAQPASPRPGPAARGRALVPVAAIDRDRLREAALIVPEGPVNSISEEFRIIKRRVLQTAVDHPGGAAQRVLICSAEPNAGKTYCAVNLALSIAAEHDREVVLVDADFAKPSVLDRLGIAGGRGLMDALVEGARDLEGCIIPTDVPGLSVLPSGRQTNNDTEYLGAAHARTAIEALTRDYPDRIVIFDSPPALAASPAATLARLVGQTVMVVRADQTREAALRDALSLLQDCEHIRLLLNGTRFSATGRSFGAYYGYGD